MSHNISVLVLFVLLASVLGRPNKEEMEAFKQKCIKITGIDPELVKGPPSMDGPVDDQRKCFRACMMKQYGKLKEDGTLDLDAAIAKVPADAPERETIVAALTDCADKKGANDCETAHEIFMCLKEKKVPFMHPHKHD